MTDEIRQSVISEIRAMRPEEQKYVDIHPPFVAGIKTYGPDGLGFYEARRSQLAVDGLEDFPIESLVYFRDELAKQTQRTGSTCRHSASQPEHHSR